MATAATNNQCKSSSKTLFGFRSSNLFILDLLIPYLQLSEILKGILDVVDQWCNNLGAWKIPALHSLNSHAKY
jgi:hypothetical protein